jgi:hypothetical protein
MHGKQAIVSEHWIFVEVLKTEEENFPVPKDGTEYQYDNYEVLCLNSFNWVAKDGDMTDAIAGGKARDGEPFYVCSGNFNQHQIPGKLYKPTGCCYVSSYGKEYCATDYSVLTRSNVEISYNVGFENSLDNSF